MVNTEGLYPVDAYFDSNSTLTSSLFNSTSLDAPTYDLIPAIQNAEGMSVMYLNVPFSYNVIDALTNSIQVTMAGSATVFTIYIPPGTYTSTTLVTVFNQILTQQYDPSAPYNGGVSVSGGVDVFNALAAKYAFTIYDYNIASTFTFYTAATGSKGSTTAFTVNFNITYPANEVIGALKTLYNSSFGDILLNDNSVVTGVNYWVPPLTYQVTGPGFIYVYSDLAQGVKDGAVRTQSTTSSILMGTGVNTNYKGYITFQNQAPTIIPFSKNNITRAQFYLLLGQRTQYCPGSDASFFNNGSPIITNYLSLMGQPWQIIVRFWYRLETRMEYVINSQGDKYTQASSQQNAQPAPSDQIVKSNNIYGKRKTSSQNDIQSGSGGSTFTKRPKIF